MSVKEVVPFLAVADMSDSITFYVDGLGFQVTNEWRPEGELRWCQIRLDGAALMLQSYDRADHDRRFSGKKGEGVTLCIFCDDAVDLYHQFTARGIKAEEPFVGNALWVTSVVDPDGYRIDFESPTDVAEETKLSELDA